MAKACDSRKSARKAQDAPLEWTTTQARRVCAITKHLLRSIDEYDHYATLCSHEKATEVSQVATALLYLTEFNLVPFSSSDKHEFIKSSKVSIELRNAGNKHFMKNNQEALLLYSKSIAASPYPKSDEEDSEVLALSFANRSAVYFVIKKYEACLRDIEQALAFKYPDAMKYKLLERRAKCYQNLGSKQEARASAEDAVTNLSTATHLPDDKMKSTIDALNKLQVDTSCVDQREPPGPSDALKPLPQKAYGQHKKISSASKCVDIRHKPLGGRHVVANRDIHPGDVLFVEEPFASLLQPEACFTHCNNCTKRSDAMIPCEKCDQVMYCSKSCRDTSWATCHRIECRVLPALRRLDVGDTSCTLALRILLVACSKHNGIVGLLNLDKELTQQTSSSVKGFDRSGKYLSSDYYQIHYLFRNIRKEPELLINWTVTAACILNCLEAYSDIFSLVSIDDSANVVMSAGGLILKYIQIMNTNIYEVTELVLKADTGESDDVDIAVALYSSLSLLNHSCDPTTSKSFHNGAVSVVIARQPIRKGEEVSMSYGSFYDHSDRATRRRDLKYKYCFDCQCVACINNWPMFDGLESLVDPTFICSVCRVPLPNKLPKRQHQWVACKVCKKKHNVWLMIEQTMLIKERVTYIYDMQNTINCPDYTSEVASIIKTLDTILLYPNQLITSCQGRLRISMKISGNHVVV